MSQQLKLSRRYIAGRQLPDKAVDLLDTAATRVKMSLTSKPPKLELLISGLKSIDMAINSQQRDSDMDLKINQEALSGLREKKSKLEIDIKSNEEKWQKESSLTRKLMELRMKKFSGNGESKDPKILEEIDNIKKELSSLQDPAPQVFAEVTSNTVAEVIEAWTGIKVGNMTRDEMTTLLQLENDLKKRVVGQDHAIKQIADVIRGAKVGMKKEEGPIGVFLISRNKRSWKNRIIPRSC